MCELFAMSSRHPATVRLSLEEFSRHGGLSGPHKDGWGIAWYEEGDVRLVKEPAPAAESACVRFVQEHPPSSTIVISHIRKATQGAHTLSNCQPFARELGGRMHVFAHNGHLDRSRLGDVLPLGSFRPVGETDSEVAFCALLERLRALWLEAGGVPPFEHRWNIVSAFAAEIRALGPANFIYSDGEILYVHAHRRMHGDAGIRPPGLHVIERRCPAGEHSWNALGLAIGSSAGEQRVFLAASVPLTDEAAWQALAEGELVAARSGEIVRRARPAG
jgi:glutamine amidotransferase